MSTLTADPGFNRGAVLGILWKAYDADNGDGSHVLGTFKEFLDVNPRTGVQASNRVSLCVCVKNTSSVAMTPGQVVKFKDGSLTEVDGLAVAATLRMGVVDEYLPAAGVPVGEVFWVVVKGPSTVVKTATSVALNAAYGPSATAGSAAAQGSNALLGYSLEATTNLSARILVRTNEGF
jgi:hypothetical protein